MSYKLIHDINVKCMFKKIINTHTYIQDETTPSHVPSHPEDEICYVLKNFVARISSVKSNRRLLSKDVLT